MTTSTTKAASLRDLVGRLEKVVDGQDFHQTAETILAQADNALALAKCAELAGRREPGGAYYRAKMWHRAEALRQKAEGEYGRNTLGLMCVQVKIGLPLAKSYITQGRVIEEAERQNEKAQAQGTACVEEMPALLREAPAAIFQYALGQQEYGAEYLLHAANELLEAPWTSAIKIHNKWCGDQGTSRKAKLDIIKPSDWWAFSHPKYRQEPDFPGSIPGEVYANALYYFAPEQGVAADAMAGSGMLERVYNDRARWQKDLDFDLEVLSFDSYPRRSFIQPHDARQPLPRKVDWLFLDPPYFGQSKHLYNGDLASATDYGEYLKTLEQVIIACATSLNHLGRLCILLPKWSGLRPSDENYDLPHDARQLAADAGLHWIDAAFISRARQQEAGSAFKNIKAKRERRMRSDVCVLNVFEKRD